MTREIKFRAWNGKKLTYNVSPFQWDYCIETSHWRCIGHRKEWDYHPFFELEGIPFKNLMQYTGLKDKNSKEIYEGDVVQWHNGNVIGSPRVVESWYCSYQPFAGDMQEDGAWHYEILGNIYENPELMKGEEPRVSAN